MLSLSPAKLLVVLVIALIVLGPEKLPEMTRKLGAVWADVRQWRGRLESEVRSTFPDLPPTHEVVQAVRSPLTFLDRLADVHAATDAGDAGPAEGHSDPSGDTTATTTNASGRAQPSRNGTKGESAHRGEATRKPQVVPDDPSMN